MLWTLGIALTFTFIAIWLGNTITRPIQRIDIQGNDELRDLSIRLGDMVGVFKL